MQAVLDSVPEWEVLLGKVVSIERPAVNAPANEVRVPEPVVRYTEETFLCQTPPGLIAARGEIRARFLWGGLSPVLNKGWLRWQGITHVLNCIGPSSPLYARILSARAADDGITYIDWCPNCISHRTGFLPVFARLEKVLKTPSEGLYVHCRSGKDRSAITIFALLQVRFAATKEEARAALQTRLGTHGRPVANLTFGHEETLRWLAQVITTP
jgi:hypothetical protein